MLAGRLVGHVWHRGRDDGAYAEDRYRKNVVELGLGKAHHYRRHAAQIIEGSKMSEIVSAEVLDWARDIATLRNLLSGEWQRAREQPQLVRLVTGSAAMHADDLQPRREPT
jgi:hypothetical protein